MDHGILAVDRLHVLLHRLAGVLVLIILDRVCWLDMKV